MGEAPQEICAHLFIADDFNYNEDEIQRLQITHLLAIQSQENPVATEPGTV